jgi:hypothetical protein
MIRNKKSLFSKTSKPMEKDELKQMHHNKKEALKSVSASLQEKCKEQTLCLQCRKPNHCWGICNGKIMAMSGRKAAGRWQKNRKVDASDDKGIAEPSSSKKPTESAIPLGPQPLISESDPIDATPTGNAWGCRGDGG